MLQKLTFKVSFQRKIKKNSNSDMNVATETLKFFDTTRKTGSNGDSSGAFKNSIVGSSALIDVKSSNLIVIDCGLEILCKTNLTVFLANGNSTTERILMSTFESNQLVRVDSRKNGKNNCKTSSTIFIHTITVFKDENT